MTKGRFVTLEGGEGVGKSTQMKALALRLRTVGKTVIETREPGGSPGAEAIRQLLLHDHDWTAQAEALLFAAARSDHVAKTIKPALAAGAWVLSDRFVDSSIAYQGGAGGLGFDAIRHLHSFGSHDFLPDRTLLLSLDETEADARTRQRDAEGPDLIGGRSRAYHEAVGSAFRQIAAEEPDRFRLIDASGSAADVTNKLFASVEDLL